MSRFLHIDSIHMLHDVIGNAHTDHPLISIIDFSKIKPKKSIDTKVVVGFYCVVFKQDSKCEWKYGRNKYDFQDGTLVFIAPGQVLEVEKSASNSKPGRGIGLFFHPDLLLGTGLNLDLPEYSYFSYEVNEALHISIQEKRILFDLLEKIENELKQNIDRHSKRLIVSNITLLLNYCIRYYDRQFITRAHSSKDIIIRFEKVLKEWFISTQLSKKGLPTVGYCAEKMHLSAGYLTDLLKKETGKSTLEHIHFFLIEKAKYLLLNSETSIKEIAFGLGFEYPQHFNKIFKKNTGMNPQAFRQKH